MQRLMTILLALIATACTIGLVVLIAATVAHLLTNL
jgi:hypothetical protein